MRRSLPGRWLALLACVAVLLTFLFIETRLANQPFDGPHEGNAWAFMGAARNHLRYGFARTLGQDLQEPNTGWYGQIEIEHRYLHHPPGLSLTLAAAIKLFGDTRATGRLTAVTFSLFSLFAVMAGAHRVFRSAWASALAGAVFTLAPLGAYYGRSIDYQTFTLPFMLWSQVLFVMQRQTGRARYRTIAIVVACLGGLYDWDVYFWILTAGIYEWLSPPPGTSRLRAAMPWAVAGAATFGLCVMQIVLIAGSGSELMNALLHWVDGTQADAPAGPVAVARAAGWFGTVFRREWALLLVRMSHGDFTGPLMVAAAVSLVAGGRRAIRDRRLTDAQRLIALSAIPGILYLLAVPAALGHEYGLMPVFGAVCWAGTEAIVSLSGPARPALGIALLLGVWWTAGPWVAMDFGSCFPPYRAFGSCERPIAFKGFGQITYRKPPRPSERR